MGPDPGWAALVLLFAASLLTVAAWLLQYWRSAGPRAGRRRGAAAEEAGARALLAALLALRSLREQWQRAWVRALNGQARRHGVRRGPGGRRRGSGGGCFVGRLRGSLPGRGLGLGRFWCLSPPVSRRCRGSSEAHEGEKASLLPCGKSRRAACAARGAGASARRSRGPKSAAAFSSSVA